MTTVTFQPKPHRAISARNATTHGLFARDVVLTHLGEDPAAFDALLQRLLEQLPPRNLLDRHYLEQIAAASWRLRRLHRWQAQIYEDDTLTEDQRLDRLDRVLRHENALTRQIDRAVRTLSRELAHLFADRARQEALEAHDVTAAECDRDPELAVCVQRRVWQTLRAAAPDAELATDALDNTHPVPDAPPPGAHTQNCQNELTPYLDSDELDRPITDLHTDGRPIFLSEQAWQNQLYMRSHGQEQRADEHAEYFRDCFRHDQRRRWSLLGRIPPALAALGDTNNDDEICQNEPGPHGLAP